MKKFIKKYLRFMFPLIFKFIFSHLIILYQLPFFPYLSFFFYILLKKLLKKLLPKFPQKLNKLLLAVLS